MQIPTEITQSFHFVSSQAKPLFLYLKTHQTARYIILVVILIMIGILLLDTKPRRSSKPIAPVAPRRKMPSKTLSNKDIMAIAGEDMLATQLDLAKAYIEKGDKNLAKNLLTSVLKSGNKLQQQEAKSLIKTL